MENQEPVQRQPLNDKFSEKPLTDKPLNPAPLEDKEPISQDEGPVTFGQWVAQNGVTLTLVLALLVFLFYKFDLAGLVNILKAFLGLSLVVFIHELGHLMAAKWCDVHVTSFSLGFGPTIPGCSFRWGETLYKLSLIPLGGYVQMVGQVDGDESSDGSEDDPRSYRNKTVGQRMLIISAGVIMNVVLAMICFVLVFRGPGKDRQAPVIAAVDTQSPSFVDGIRSGWVVTKLNGTENPTFEDLMYAVRNSLEGEQIQFVFKDPYSDKTYPMDIEPLKKQRENPMIGLRPAETTQLIEKRYAPRYANPTLPGSAAAHAAPAIEFGDTVIGIRAAKAEKWIELRDDPRFPGHGQKDYFQLKKALQDLAGKPIEIKVARGDKDERSEATALVPPAFGKTIGVRMAMGPITSIRKGSPAEKAGIVAGKDGAVGDIIKAVEAPLPGGGVKRWAASDLPAKALPEKAETVVLDPETLPYELRRAMDEVKDTLKPEQRKVKLVLQRQNSAPGPETDLKTFELDWSNDWKYEEYVLIYKDSPLPIPELGLAFQIQTRVAAVTSPKLGKDDNPLQAEDSIKKVRFHFMGPDGKEEAGDDIDLTDKDKKENNVWAYVSDTFFNSVWSMRITKMTLVVDRNNKEKDKEIELVPQSDPNRPLIDRGFVFTRDVRNEKASSVFGAIGLGLRDTHRSIMNVFSNLRGIILGRLPVDKNLGGPGRIGEMAYRIAGFDFWEFVFFIGLISINIAVINFLPIPVLDGGHMVFLLYEKFRGKPASEGVRIGATYAGLAIILCLMGFVIFLDISHYLR
ncbi:MAG: site-2 protease family protein [Gemmataceae bacterium]